MRLLPAVLLVVILPSSASALKMSARLTASLHSWENQDDDSTSVAHNTIHQLVSLDVMDLGVKGLSLHAYGRGFIHAEGSESRRRLAIYSTYADWTRIGKRLDLRLGRQRIFAGVGRGTVDGARAILSLPHSVKLLAYAGIEAPGDRSTDVRAWDESHMYGVRASVRRWKTTLSLSFADESRKPSGAVSKDLDGDELDLTTLARRLVGAEVSTTYLPGTDLYGRVEVDAIRWEPTRFQTRARVAASPRLRLSGELDYRRPMLDANSILSVFPFNPSTRIEGTATYLLRRGFQLTGLYSVVLFTDDETHRVRLGLSRGYSTISYYRRSGYGGDRDGLSLGSRLPITSCISVRGSLNLSTYRLSDVQKERTDALAGVLALDYAHPGKFAASLEGQVLENKTYDYDLRLFAKVTWWINVQR